MYALIVYDVEVGRVTKVHKLLKRHLHWVQNSVFEGEVTTAQLATIESDLGKLINAETDSVLIYTAREQRWLNKQSLGRDKNNVGNFI